MIRQEPCCWWSSALRNWEIDVGILCKNSWVQFRYCIVGLNDIMSPQSAILRKTQRAQSKKTWRWPKRQTVSLILGACAVGEVYDSSARSVYAPGVYTGSMCHDASTHLMCTQVKNQDPSILKAYWAQTDALIICLGRLLNRLAKQGDCEEQQAKVFQTYQLEWPPGRSLSKFKLLQEFRSKPHFWRTAHTQCLIAVWITRMICKY